MTPHSEARPGDYAQTVLLPGDPLRAQWMAETFLTGARCVNRLRGALGFTGSYRGKPVSIQATGMGRPSFAIYLHELVTAYGVRIAIRTGSCGGLQGDVGIRELFIAQSAIQEVDLARGGPVGRPDPALLDLALAASADVPVRCRCGPMLSSDHFYHPKPEGRFDGPRRAGMIAVDMETAGLFDGAERLGMRALSICTVVDNPVTGEETAMSERQALFGDLARLSLEVANAAS